MHTDINRSNNKNKRVIKGLHKIMKLTHVDEIYDDLDASNRIMFDTGAEVNAFSNRNIFDSLDLSENKILYAANDFIIRVAGEGVFLIVISGKKYNMNAYYTPDLKINLLGCSQLNKHKLIHQSTVDNEIYIGKSNDIKNGIPFIKIGNLFYSKQVFKTNTHEDGDFADINVNNASYRIQY